MLLKEAGQHDPRFSYSYVVFAILATFETSIDKNSGLHQFEVLFLIVWHSLWGIYSVSHSISVWKIYSSQHNSEQRGLWAPAKYHQLHWKQSGLAVYWGGKASRWLITVVPGLVTVGEMACVALHSSHLAILNTRKWHAFLPQSQNKAKSIFFFNYLALNHEIINHWFVDFTLFNFGDQPDQF